MSKDESVGLFLGAGASYELGMPLVWNLTGELKGYFTPDHLRELNEGWRRQGGGFEDVVIETTIALLGRDDLHYENILGSLQTLSTPTHQPLAKQYGDLYQRMVEIVYLLLYPRQAGSLPYILSGLPPFEGLAGFVKQSNPVWAFSLNHDVMFQLIAQHCGIPIRDGFWPGKVLTISSNQPNAAKISLEAEVLHEADLKNGNFYFFKPGQFGINLLRIHGALDMFTFNDDRDLCRLRPVTSDLDGHLAALRLINQEVGYWDRGGKAHVTNEVTYADETGEEQFLRRSLLAGGRKFDKRFHQTLPQEMLTVFRSFLGSVQKLYVVGYSFGDGHIDDVLQKWLEQSRSHAVIIVDPSRKMLPTPMAHLAAQIEIRSEKASEFFAGYRDKPMTPTEKLIQDDRAARRPAFEKTAAKKWPSP